MKLKIKELSNRLSFVKPAETSSNPYSRIRLIVSDIIKTVILYVDDFKGTFIYYYGQPKLFLDDLYAGKDSLDILLIGDSNIHFGSYDGGYMYGWGYNLEEVAGITCYATPLYPGITRTLTNQNGAPGHRAFLYTAANTVYKNNLYWLAGNGPNGLTLNANYPPVFDYLPGNGTTYSVWLGSHQGDTYANLVNVVWNSGLTANTYEQFGKGWQPFNGYADWAYLKEGITYDYGAFHNIMIFNKQTCGFTFPSKLYPTSGITGNTYEGTPFTNRSYYGNFNLNDQLEYRVVNAKFPYTGITGNIRLSARYYSFGSGLTATNGGAIYPIDVSTRSTTSKFYVSTDVLGISAGINRHQVEFTWSGENWTNPDTSNRISTYTRGPIGVLLNSVIRKNTKGYAINSFHAKSGGTTTNIADGILAAPRNALKIYLKEIYDRQISAGGTGRILVFINYGVNDYPDTTLFGTNTDRIVNKIVAAWQALGLDREKIAFLITQSHASDTVNWTDPGTGYTGPNAQWYSAVSLGLTAKYGNAVILNTNQYGIASKPFLEAQSAYIFTNSFANEYTNNASPVVGQPDDGFGYRSTFFSTGRTANDVHLSQGRPSGLSGEGGYARVVSGIITAVRA